MNRKDARKKAEELVSNMTVEEKASQLRYDAPAIKRLGIPAYNWWNEAPSWGCKAGTATVFPQAIGMAASFDEELIHQMGAVIAEEGRAKYNAASKQEDRDIYKGLTFWSPNVNIFRDPRWGRGHETYGEDPFLTSRPGSSLCKGTAGGWGNHESRCLRQALCRYTPARKNSGTSLTPASSQKDLEETYLPAFEALVKEGHVEAVNGRIQPRKRRTLLRQQDP